MAAEGVLDEEPLVGPDSRTGGPNFVPLPYRRVSYQLADFPLTDAGLQTIVGRDAYRRTEFVVFHDRDRVAVAAIETADRQPLFAPITRAAWLSQPRRTRFVVDRAVDVGLPSQLAAKAVELGLAADETLVVLGRYEHVNFIARPAPIAITVFEVAPPDPPKLWDLVERVLAVAPVAAALPRLERIDLPALAAATPPGPGGYLFPCRASGFEGLGAAVHFLDERPERADWLLVGCERSRQIHEHLYGDRPRSLEMCPRLLAGVRDEPTILKCCLLEEGLERDGQVVVVPWGADHDQVEEGLRELVGPA
jgi:hypothetical protein